MIWRKASRISSGMLVKKWGKVNYRQNSKTDGSWFQQHFQQHHFITVKTPNSRNHTRETGSFRYTIWYVPSKWRDLFDMARVHLRKPCRSSCGVATVLSSGTGVRGYSCPSPEGLRKGSIFLQGSDRIRHMQVPCSPVTSGHSLKLIQGGAPP